MQHQPARPTSEFFIDAHYRPRQIEKSFRTSNFASVNRFEEPRFGASIRHPGSLVGSFRRLAVRWHGFACVVSVSVEEGPGLALHTLSSRFVRGGTDGHGPPFV